MSKIDLAWQEVNLGNHVDLLTGFPFKSQQFTDESSDIPLVKGANVHQGYIDWKGAKRWTASEFSQYKKFQLQSGDVVVAMDRPWIEAGLKYAWIHHNDPKSLLVQRVARLRGTNGLLTVYLRYLIGSPAFTNYIKPIVTGVNVPHISADQIKGFKFLLPPLPTQRKIAAILSAYDDLIENNTRRIEILEEMARSLYREWFVKFRFPGHEQVQMVNSELGLIPEGWEVTSIGNHINTQKGYAFKSSWYQEEGIKIVKVSDFTDDSIDISKLVSISEEIAEQYKKHELEANDIIIQTVGSWASNPQSVVGKVIRVHNIAAKVLLNQNAVKVIPKESINQHFLFYSLKNERFKSYIIGCAQGAASQASITLDAIREFKILLPPSSLLNSLDDFVSPMWKLINNLENKNLNLRCTRDYLLPKLISGEIDVENLNINTGEIAA